MKSNYEMFTDNSLNDNSKQCENCGIFFEGHFCPNCHISRGEV
jgi:rubrerythrin